MNLWLTFIAGLFASTLFTLAGLAFIFNGNWPAAFLLFAVDLAVYRYFTYRLEHGL